MSSLCMCVCVCVPLLRVPTSTHIGKSNLILSLSVGLIEVSSLKHSPAPHMYLNKKGSGSLQSRDSTLISVVDSGFCVDQGCNNLEAPSFGSIHPELRMHMEWLHSTKCLFDKPLLPSLLSG